MGVAKKEGNLGNLGGSIGYFWDLGRGGGGRKEGRGRKGEKKEGREERRGRGRKGKKGRKREVKKRKGRKKAYKW